MEGRVYMRKNIWIAGVSAVVGFCMGYLTKSIADTDKIHFPEDYYDDGYFSSDASSFDEDDDEDGYFSSDTSSFDANDDEDYYAD